jgi:uncharacterized protein
MTELMPPQLMTLATLVFLIAILYASVGHGGASGYLALLSFTTLSPQEMSTTALLLNILVATTAFITYARARYFSWSLTWPFLATSIPAAFIGGMLHVSEQVYFLLLALALFAAAIRMLLPLKVLESNRIHKPNPWTAYATGGSIGLLSGIVGVGGGIFLSPLMVLLRWADPKTTSATAAFFILLNSLSGLTGRFTQGHLIVGNLWWLLPAGVLGGLIGAYLGARLFSVKVLCRALALVLLVAAFKMVIQYY